MTISFHALPMQRITVTHGVTDYTIESHVPVSRVTWRENAASIASVTSLDPKFVELEEFIDVADILQIEYKYLDGLNTYRQVFGGYIRDLKASTTDQGDMLTLDALGYGVALANMVVRQEYGEFSTNPTEKTLTDILTDAAVGIVPKYVEKVLASATDSGYSIDTSEVAALTHDYPYLFFTKPAIKCLEDLLDLYRASKVPNAGAHWLVVPDGSTAYLCIGTVGAHESSVEATWPTWYDINEAGSTLEVGVDQITSAFQKTRAEANYVLYQGHYRWPANGDIYTENKSGLWDTSHVDLTLTDDNAAGDFVVGSYSLRANYTSNGLGQRFYFPSTFDLAIDLTKLETAQNVPSLQFDVQRNAGILTAGVPGVPFVEVGTGDPAGANYFASPLTLTDVDKWYHVKVQMGNYIDAEGENATTWIDGGGDWSDIDWIGFFFVDAGAGSGQVWIDGMFFDGQLTRAAYDSVKIASQRCRMLHITDDVPKDDTLNSADDSGMMAQFAKAELARAAATPWVGEVEVPLLERLLPGQKMHIHALQKSDGSFRIDMDMRAIQVIHTFHLNPIPTTKISLTSDLKNSFPAHPTDEYARLFKAVAPAFQDRMRASLISRDVDLLQTVLGTDYNTATWD